MQIPPATRLIINADDLGLTPGINRAVFELHRAGALSSATLMANGPAFQNAVALAHQHPGLGIGCHVVLTDGIPLSPARSIPSLLDPASSSAHPKLRGSLAAFARAALLGRLNEAEIEREATAQISRLIEAGVRPTHLDTHKHTHLFPAVLRPLLRVAERLGIPALRNPFEQPWSLRLRSGTPLRRTEIRLLNLFESSFHRRLSLGAGRVRTTSGSTGVAATGSLDRISLAAILNHLPEGTWELVCHPGYLDAALGIVATRLRQGRQTELEALLALVPAHLASHPRHQLVSFSALIGEPIHTIPTSQA